MQPQAAPAAAPAWGIRVITSLDKKLREYEPTYSNEVDEEDPTVEKEWKVPAKQAKLKRCKNGKKSMRIAKQDFSADGSFGRWRASQDKADHVVVPAEDAARDWKARTQHREAKSTPIQMDRSEGDATLLSPASAHPGGDSSNGKIGDRMISEDVVSVPSISRRDDVLFDFDFLEYSEAPPEERRRVRFMKPEEGDHASCQGSCCKTKLSAKPDESRRLNIADRKREMKARKRMADVQAESTSKAPSEIEAIAKEAYEIFYELPEGTATIKQVENTSAKVLGWASAPVHLCQVEEVPVEENPEDKRERMCAVQRCLLNHTAAALKDVSLMTKPHLEMATSSGLLLSAPSSAEMNADGWELLEITVDSGACDTVLPTGMLSSINVVSTEASRNLETYEVANGCTIVNEGEKRCVMMTPGTNHHQRRAQTAHVRGSDVRRRLRVLNVQAGRVHQG